MNTATSSRSAATAVPSGPLPLPGRQVGRFWEIDCGDHAVRLSNLDKVYWPDSGQTKGDLLRYYFTLAPLLLPHLHDRPLTLRRFPNGIEEPAFFAKHAPASRPSWLPTATVAAESGQRDITYVLAQDVASLLWVANSGAIEMHPLHARWLRPDIPDYAMFDLDPSPPYVFSDVVAVAKLINVVLVGLGLRAYPKTSGATGMQLFVPLDDTATFARTRHFVELVGRLVVQAAPDLATMQWSVDRREGKVFIDHNMNRRGANIASVYSVRPLPGAPVSTPLRWEELDDPRLDARSFSIETIWPRLKDGDLFAAVLHDRQCLDEALVGLGADPSEATQAPPLRASHTPRARPTPARGKVAPAAVPATPVLPTNLPVTSPGLEDYTRKRDFSRTPEPAGTAADTPPRCTDTDDPTSPPHRPHPAGLWTEPVRVPGRQFTIQQHHARRLHHDVRFEHDGVLVSFAVPKRLPEAHGVRHLAVRTEDHPLSYLTFSGEIPAGAYGGGSVRLFDFGSYDLLEFTPEKLSVRLHGARYKDIEYHFVRTHTARRRPSRSGSTTPAGTPGGNGADNGSGDGKDWLCLLAKASAPPPPLDLPVVQPMLATPWPAAFDDPDWIFEVKWDGYRCIATLDETTRLTSRGGLDLSATLPEFANLHRQLVARGAVLDAEVVALQPDGTPSFQLLQGRLHHDQSVVSPAALALFAFDLLWLDGESLLDRPLSERRARLEEVLVQNELLQVPAAIPSEGRALFEQARARGLEGIMAKRAAASYHPGRRSADWRKIKTTREQDCIVIGWTPGQGRRAGSLGALLLAVRDPAAADHADHLRYVGKVGTGLSDALLKALHEELAGLEAQTSAVTGVPALSGLHWVRPHIVVSVGFQEWTRDGRLRHPALLRVREDLSAQDCCAQDC